MVILKAKRKDSAGYISHLGKGDMVFAFFSSVSYHLEGKDNWGSRFPRLLLDLCDTGMVKYEHLDELLEELNIICFELQKLPLSAAVYDIGDLSLPIPWEVLPGAENNNLAQPWVTPRGDISYFNCFPEIIQYAKTLKSSIFLMFSYEEDQWEPMKKGRSYWIADK